jgi:hypothetical protein
MSVMCVRGACVSALLLFSVGCEVADRSTGHRQRSPIAISTVSGDHQVGAVRRRLEHPLRIRLVDASGEPVAVVEWSASEDGAIVPPSGITDAEGIASAVWMLGPLDGEQHARASSGDSLRVEFAATANIVRSDVALTPLTLTTPDGSGQTVHPDYVAMPSTWGGAGAGQYLAITPYPGGNANFENPSLFTSSDEIAWAPPAGVQNPLVLPTRGYLSDPDVVYNSESNELWLYFRAVDDQNEVRLMKSSDGVHFSAPVTIVSGPNHVIVSPTVVRRGPGDWRMWSVNSNVGCAASTTTVELRRSTNGVDWSAPHTVSLSQPGYSVWHLDVQWVPSRQEYWALYNGKTAGSCTTPALFLATSTDGETWRTFPSPVLARGAIREFEDIVYRSTFAYDPSDDAISLWYSGARYESPNYVWRSAYERRARSAVFDAVALPPNKTLIAAAARRDIPPLLDAP